MKEWACARKHMHQRQTAGWVYPIGAGGRDFGKVDLRESVEFRWRAAIDRNDFDAFDDLLHPDATRHAPAGLSTHGIEAEKQVWREALVAMPDLVHEVQEVDVNGRIEMIREIVREQRVQGLATVQAQAAAFGWSRLSSFISARARCWKRGGSPKSER